MQARIFNLQYNFQVERTVKYVNFIHLKRIQDFLICLSENKINNLLTFLFKRNNNMYVRLILISVHLYLLSSLMSYLSIFFALRVFVTCKLYVYIKDISSLPYVLF